MSIIYRSEILRYLYAWDLWDILKRQKESRNMSICWRICRYISRINHHSSLRMVARMPHDSKSKRGFPRAIMSEDRRCFASGEGIVKIMNNWFFMNRDRYIIECKHTWSIGQSSEKSIQKTLYFGSCMHWLGIMHQYNVPALTRWEWEVYFLITHFYEKSPWIYWCHIWLPSHHEKDDRARATEIFSYSLTIKDLL